MHNHSSGGCGGGDSLFKGGSYNSFRSTIVKVVVVVVMVVVVVGVVVMVLVVVGL